MARGERGPFFGQLAQTRQGLVGRATVTKSEAVGTALARGWIDGQLDRFDDRHWLVRFTPRRPKSKWSRINRVTAERLIADGTMTPRGLAEVEEAKSDGRWDAAYEPQRRRARRASRNSSPCSRPARRFTMRSGDCTVRDRRDERSPRIGVATIAHEIGGEAVARNRE